MEMLVFIAKGSGRQLHVPQGMTFRLARARDSGLFQGETSTGACLEERSPEL